MTVEADTGSGARTGRRRGRSLGLHDRALGLLAVRMRSRRELERRLLRAGFEPQEVADELARLETAGLIDDDAFAQAFAEQAVTGSKGARAISDGLYAKGIDRATIERTIATTSEGETERAYAFARTRAGRFTGMPAPTAFRRLSAALMRRGFDPETSLSAARAALAVDGSEA